MILVFSYRLYCVANTISLLCVVDRVYSHFSVLFSRQNLAMSLSLSRSRIHQSTTHILCLSISLSRGIDAINDHSFQGGPVISRRAIVETSFSGSTARIELVPFELQLVLLGSNGKPTSSTLVHQSYSCARNSCCSYCNFVHW